MPILSFTENDASKKKILALIAKKTKWSMAIIRFIS